MIATVSALLYALAIAGVIGFQICLIAGAPWGHLTQGGQRSGRLPVSGRVFALISIGILLFKAAGVLSAAGLPPGWPFWTTLVALVIQALVTLVNWITRSSAERKLWAPITSVMLVLAIIVAAGHA